MKSTSYAALFALLSAGTQAVHPIHGHRHAGRHADHHLEKRDLVWVTEYEVETVTVLETVYDYGSFVSTAAETTSPASPSSSQPAPTTSTAVATTLQTSSSPPAAPSSSSTSTTTSAAPVPTTSSPAYQAPSSSYQPPIQSTPSPYQAPPPSTTSAAPATTSAAPATVSSAAPGGATGDYQSGEVTFYDFDAGAMGACGIALDPTANTVAISEELYGTYGNPNDSPMCGKKLTIIGTDGTSYSATVADRCVACDNTHLDLTHGLFGTVTGSNYNAGVVPIKWAWD